MKRVAKLVIIDPEDNYLLMYRSDHPTFGEDPDLPGGTSEGDETAAQTCVREAYEEISISLQESDIQQVYSGTDYSSHDTNYSLFIAKVSSRPTIQMSWEHSGYEWLDKSRFLERSKNAVDTYMHMVYDVLKD